MTLTSFRIIPRNLVAFLLMNISYLKDKTNKKPIDHKGTKSTKEGKNKKNRILSDADLLKPNVINLTIFIKSKSLSKSVSNAALFRFR